MPDVRVQKTIDSRENVEQQIKKEPKNDAEDSNQENTTTTNTSVQINLLEAVTNTEKLSSYERSLIDERSTSENRHDTIPSSTNRSSAISSFTPASIAEAVFQRGKVKSKTEIMKEQEEILRATVKIWEQNEESEERKLIPKR